MNEDRCLQELKIRNYIFRVLKNPNIDKYGLAI